MSTKKKQRTGWKSFLTPGWALALALVIAFSYFAITALAPWQLGKNERNSATNQRLQEAFEKDPVPLADVVPGTDSTVAEKDEWTHVTLQGQFQDQDVVLRNRHVDGTVVFQILSPFETQDGTDIMVNRGFVAPTSSGSIPEFPAAPTGQADVSGYLRLDETTTEDKPAQSQGHPVVSSISAQLNEHVVGEELVDGYVQLDGDSIQPDMRAIPLPQLESGPYLSYGIQWIAFGIIAPIGLGWFVYSEIRERRREKSEQQELSVSSSDAQPASTAEDAVNRKLADRYGKKKRF